MQARVGPVATFFTVCHRVTPRLLCRMVLRRFGAIGDVHTEDTLLAAAIAHLRRLGVDAILAVGDIVDGEGDVDRCCALLRDGGVVAVRGNHERWALEGSMRELPHATLARELQQDTLQFLRTLPPTRRLQTVLGDLLLCHGVGTDDMVRLLPEDEGYALSNNDALSRVLSSGVELMVCGHTHRPMVRTIQGLTIVNAGTLHRHDAPCFVHVDLERKRAQYYELDDEGGVREGLAYDFGKPGDDVWGAGW